MFGTDLTSKLTLKPPNLCTWNHLRWINNKSTGGGQVFISQNTSWNLLFQFLRKCDIVIFYWVVNLTGHPPPFLGSYCKKKKEKKRKKVKSTYCHGIDRTDRSPIIFDMMDDKNFTYRIYGDNHAWLETKVKWQFDVLSKGSREIITSSIPS